MISFTMRFEIDRKHQCLSSVKKIFLSLYKGRIGIRLYQAFYELVVNIYRYAYDRKPNGKIDLFFHDDGKEISLEIRDCGRPVTEQDLERMQLAMRRSRAHDSMQDFESGDGLFIVQTIAELDLPRYDKDKKCNIVRIRTTKMRLR